jgi:amino acid adenylation domain-containing protein
LYRRFDPRHFRIDVREAPLLRVYAAHDRAGQRWLMMLLLHHLAGDHTTLEVMQEEIRAYRMGEGEKLPAPQPFRNLVAQARMGMKVEEHEAFFRHMLGTVEEITAPFGLVDVRGDGSGIEEAHVMLEDTLGKRARESARKLGVSAASLFHVAWGQVLAQLSGHEDVVFGTVLFGRMQGGAGSDRVMGMFINTLPVRIEIGKEGTEASVRRTHAVLGELLRHEHASLALAQRCSKVASPAPLFSSLLNYRHSQERRQDSAKRNSALEGVQILRGEERTNYPFTMAVDDLGDGFRLVAQTPGWIGPERICQFLKTALEGLVESLETSPARAVRTLPVLPESERRQVVYEWNQTQAEYGGEKCVQELFEEQVGRTPEAVAVRYGEDWLSYAELNRLANQMAHYLSKQGVGPEKRVALCVERSLEMIVGLLAVLKAGGAYVPLDTDYPVERLRWLVEDSVPALLLTEAQARERLRGIGPAVPILELGETALWKAEPESNPDRWKIGLTPQHLAYVIYTSGSTGVPKGVMVSHANLVNSTWARKTTYGSYGRFLLVSPVSFDSSVAGIFGTLSQGGTLCLVEQEVVRDPAMLRAKIESSGIESLLCVPSLYQQLLEGGEEAVWGSDLKLVMVAGEACPRDLVMNAGARKPQAELFNEYGPTEAAVWATVYRCGGEETGGSVPIGRPIANTRVYIVDGKGEAAPVGVAGELYIGGAGVARGYLKRAELTAERFVPDPFVAEAGARMYRTGDWARWRKEGTVEFLGRMDDQVKIRGYRIELGEIETCLREHEQVGQAAVIVREDAPGDKRLVAYYTGKSSGRAEGAPEERAVEPEELRSHLAQKLPAYMVPAGYVRLESLPLTANGKLDRKALPAPEAAAYGAQEYEAPEGETETALAEIWKKVLRIERVGRNDNFFELGGHSLLAIQLVLGIQQEFGIRIGLREVFELPRFSSLAAQVRATQFAEFDQEELARVARMMRGA